MQRQAQRDALAGQASARGQVSAATLGAFGALLLLAAIPRAAHGDWTFGAQAGLRHDDNVGNAQSRSDRVADTAIGAQLSAFQLFPLGESYSLTLGADLRGESFHRITGLDNGSLEGVFQLKRKWGLGAFAPWVRAGVGVARSSYDDSDRNAWIYRAILASGRRIDERWNLWADYSFERRAAKTRPEEVPGLSGDAFSEDSHRIAINLEYSLMEGTFLAVRILARHGDVVSTTAPNADVFYSSRALAEDPAFGTHSYAYKLTGTTYGWRVGINFAPTEHSLLGLDFERFDTHAAGGNSYAKSIPEITWSYGFR